MLLEEVLTRTSDSAYLKSRADLSRQSSLSSAQHDVQKFLRCGNGLNILPSGLHGGQRTACVQVED